jgi:hypothetical protein
MTYSSTCASTRGVAIGEPDVGVEAGFAITATVASSSCTWPLRKPPTARAGKKDANICIALSGEAGREVSVGRQSKVYSIVISQKL